MTQFTVEAHHVGKIWGGFRSYDESKTEELYAALHKFTVENADDQRAAVIFTEIIALAGSKTTLVFYFYDSPQKPTSGALKDFLDIKPLLDTTKVQSYASLVSASLKSDRKTRAGYTNVIVFSTRAMVQPPSCSMLESPSEYDFSTSFCKVTTKRKLTTL